MNGTIPIGNNYEIVALSSQPDVIGALADILIEVVAGGGSVGFMHPVAKQEANGFWQASLEAAARRSRVVLGAHDHGQLIGTVTLLLDCPENQPHRAEIAKLMTRVSYRGQGVARALLLEAERVAVQEGRSMLTLDTAAEGGAAGLYEGMGYQKAGIIPDFALKPHGGLTATIIYWKRIAKP